MTKGMKIIHVNTRSIFRKITLLDQLYSEFDIVCCTETWLDDRIPDNLIKINNMKIFRRDRRCNITDYNVHVYGGGVCIYVSNKWSDYVNVIREATVVTKDYEIMSITIDKPNFKKLFVSCVYKPPKGKIDVLYKFMTDIVNRFQGKKYEIWILGDFNTDFLKRDEINIIRTFRFLKKLGLKQLIDAVTRPNKKNGSCIDWIITDSYFVKDSGILDDLVSDHYSVYCVRKKVKEHISMTVRNVRDYSAFDKNNYEVLLSNSDWSVFDRTEVPEIQWEIMLRNVRNILSIMCPYKRVNTRQDTTPWITQDIYTLIREKKKLVKRYKMTRDPNTLIEMRRKRNELNSKIDKAKSLYIQNALKKTVKNPESFGN